MIILEDPYVSPELATFAADRQEPVLDTPAARQAGLDYGLHLNLVSSRDFGRLCCQGQRLYSNSENALDWLYSRSGNAGLVRATELLKNKLLFRQRLAPLFPDFHFRELTLRDVKETHFESLPGPCVLKPAVGFFSLGVYSIENAQQWRAARDDIAAGAVRWRKEYPAAVLDNQVWLLESLIQGTEYAVDVYFNSRGEAVICNILQHDFASSEDVSDRLYYTSADIIRRMSGPLEAWFDQINERLGLRDYPVHVELRRDADGHMVPIEFNPLRFAGWCCTDISLFAWGFPTYGCYLDDRRPDWDSILPGREDKLYTLIVLNKPAACPPVRCFDYDALCARFHKVLHLRRGFYDRYSHFGFLFTETPAHDRTELDAIVRDDLLGKAAKGLTPDKIPTMMNYTTLLNADSMYNTPPCWCIYMTGLVMNYLENEIGGLENMQKRNAAKAKVLYDYLDGQDFYKNPVEKKYRSMMNVTFTSPDADTDKAFCAAATEAGFVNLKGHRLVGGMRASIYNAMPAEGIDKLVDFMEKFRREH